MSEQDGGTEALPSDEELANMSREELAMLGAKMDGVELVEYPDPWPVKGTRAERRAERVVAFWFILAALGALGFIAVFGWWPWTYQDPGHQFWYNLYTPLIGLTLGITVLGLGIGVLVYVKKFVPHEVAVQERHDGPSAEIDRQTVLAELADAGVRSTIARRSLIKRSAGAAAGLMGLGLVIFPVGGFIKNPWSKNTPPQDTLRFTGWYSGAGSESPGERVFLRQDTGDPTEVALVSPADMDAGGLMTVFPFRESERNDPEKLLAAYQRVDNPTLLFRFRPEDAQHVIKRQGQASFNYGDYYAFSKICTHLGCPASLYEEQTQRILCPCHQSQFNALEYCKPVFGPAARALPQLPLAVDEQTGYFYAVHDYIEPVGPGYWERGA
ncbi:MAG TPA: ubiquinol-cytochrome c reductase iron-sulfur subunit [Pseudonocardiaceae bacterium]|jgi:ubiquinol-cytochrome c reductase iron-sulfur subunit|nr:ubiquinol-cytochrome c reductase iron-sulfur subunit [Pseudonocardiaceae bacterium]